MAKIFSDGLQKVVTTLGSQAEPKDVDTKPSSWALAYGEAQVIENLEIYLRTPTLEGESWGYGSVGRLLCPIPEKNHSLFSSVMKSRQTALDRLESWTNFRQGIMLNTEGQGFVLGFQGTRPLEFASALDDLHQLIVTQTRDKGYPVGIQYQIWDSQGNVRLMWKEMGPFLSDQLA